VNETGAKENITYVYSSRKSFIVWDWQATIFQHDNKLYILI